MNSPSSESSRLNVTHCWPDELTLLCLVMPLAVGMTIACAILKTAVGHPVSHLRWVLLRSGAAAVVVVSLCVAGWLLRRLNRSLTSR